MLIRAKAENPSAEPGLASFTVEEASGDLASNADSDQVSGECLCLFSCSVVSRLDYYSAMQVLERLKALF